MKHATHAQTAIAAREAERLRIAQDLHDAFGGNLTAAALLLARLAHDLEQAEPALRDTVLHLRELIADSKHGLQQVIFALRAPELAQGLFSALQNLCAKWQSYTDIVCHLKFSAEQDFIEQAITELDNIPEQQALAIYRLVQEGLHNVAKHAAATQAQVELQLADNILLLKITDNGNSTVKHGNRTGGHGISGMQERISAWHGSLEWVAAAQGKSLLIRLPLAQCQATALPAQGEVARHDGAGKFDQGVGGR